MSTEPNSTFIHDKLCPGPNGLRGLPIRNCLVCSDQDNCMMAGACAVDLHDREPRALILDEDDLTTIGAALQGYRDHLRAEADSLDEEGLKILGLPQGELTEEKVKQRDGAFGGAEGARAVANEMDELFNRLGG